jgi:hypothetical protein
MLLTKPLCYELNLYAMLLTKPLCYELNLYAMLLTKPLLSLDGIKIWRTSLPPDLSVGGQVLVAYSFSYLRGQVLVVRY